MEMEDIMLIKTIQKKENKYQIISFICDINGNRARKYKGYLNFSGFQTVDLRARKERKKGRRKKIS